MNFLQFMYGPGSGLKVTESFQCFVDTMMLGKKDRGMYLGVLKKTLPSNEKFPLKFTIGFADTV